MNAMLITPNQTFMMRLMPAIALEGAALIVCVLLYVYTEQLAWIFGAVAVGVAFGIYVLVMLARHRSEWRVTSQKVIR